MTARRGYLLLGMLALAGLLGVAGEVAAADDRVQRARARAHFKKGERLYNVSRYREALEEFKEGFLLRSDPVFLFNIAQCHRLLGERADALTYYRRYLGAEPSSANRPEVERRIRELEAATFAEAARASAAPPQPPPVAATAMPLPVAPPAAPPAAGALPAAALHVQAPPPGSETGRPLYRRWWFWGVVGAAVSAGVVGVVLATRRVEAPCPDPCLLR